MGTKVAPTYATLVLGFLEEKMYAETHEIFGDEFSNYIKNQWKRYLNDCFIFWNRSRDDLLKFHKYSMICMKTFNSQSKPMRKSSFLGRINNEG